LGRDWIDRPALDVLREHRLTVVEHPALLSPQTLRGLWRELDDLASQRYNLAQAVDRIEHTLHTKNGDLKDTVQRLAESHQLVEDTQRRLDGFDSPWSRFRNRDTIGTLHKDIEHSRDWIGEYETRAATLRSEIAELTGHRDYAVAHRGTTRPGLVDRSREIRSVLDCDATLRVARVEHAPPAHLRGILRDNADAKLRRATIGQVEQYRAAYGIESDHVLGARPGYDDTTRANLYRNLKDSVDQLTPTRARDREIDMGVEI
jgi:hypothetical protein